MPETLANLRSRIAVRADVVDDPHIGADSLTEWANIGYSKLWDVIVEAHERRLAAISASQVVAVGAASVALSTFVSGSILRLLDLERQEGSEWYSIPPVNFPERHSPEELSFDLTGETIYLYPDEAAAGTYRIWYIPECPEMSDAGVTAVDAAIQYGWTEYIVLHGARCALEAQERSTTDIDKVIEKMEPRLRASVSVRNAGRVRTVADVRGPRPFTRRTRSGYPAP